MKILFYSIKNFERPFIEEANKYGYEIEFTEEPLSLTTADLSSGFDAVCIFANDDASAPVISQLKRAGIRFIAQRSSGYDNLDLHAASENNIAVANVPHYSPYSVAEHALALALALNRKLIIADRQVHQNNFLVDELVGFDLHGKTVGIIGTGRTGGAFAKIMHGLGCILMAYDVNQSQELQQKYDVYYVGLNTIFSMADLISIHIPLTKETRYLVNDRMMSMMKKGTILINTGRGAIVRTEDVIRNLESGRLGGYGTDVYEKEKGMFFYDHQNDAERDPLLTKLISFPNVIVTPHQAFATRETLACIATTTFYNLHSWENKVRSGNELNFLKTVQVPSSIK